MDYEHQGRRKDGSLTWVSTTARAIRGANGDLLGFEGPVIEITERKETEEKLRQSEERYRTVVEEQTELICRFLPDKTITFVNEAYCRYFGMKPEKLLGNDFMQLLPSRDQAALEEHFSELSREDPVKTVEHRVFKPDSELGWQQWTNRAIFDEKGRLVEYQAVGRDITERKQAEERFRATFEQAAVGFAQVSVDGRMLMVNEKLCEILGYAREELLALHVQDVSYPEDHDADLVQARRLLAGEIDAYTIEKRYVKKDRSLVWTNLVVSLVRDPSGEPEYLIGAGEDITQRKRAEEALRQSEERFRAQYRGIPVPTISWRKVEDDFELVDYNEAADELTQGKLPNFIGLKASEWYSDDPQIIEAMTSCYGEGVTVYQEKPWRMRTTGEQKHLAVTFAYIPPDLVMTHAEDITERKKLEENQQRFLTNAAHQLKTPITTIAGAAELLVTKQDLHVVKRRQLLDHIFDESRHMQRLADTLLRLSRVSWDQREPDLELDLKVVDLAAAVRQAAERMMSLAESAGLALCVEGDGACVLADPEWLQEVLLILLSNAIKHSNPGRNITLRLLEGAITVEDEGAGISAVDTPYVFERFYKGKGSMEGFGLGLSICQELVEQMGGYVTLSSEEGVGTSVRVELQGAS